MRRWRGGQKEKEEVNMKKENNKKEKKDNNNERATVKEDEGSTQWTCKGREKLHNEKERKISTG